MMIFICGDYQKIVKGRTNPLNFSSFCGIIPHLGVHNADLTFAEDGNSSFLNDSPHLLNIYKYNVIRFKFYFPDWSFDSVFKIWFFLFFFFDSETLHFLHKVKNLMRYGLEDVRLVQSILFREWSNFEDGDDKNYSKQILQLRFIIIYLYQFSLTFLFHY